MQGFSDRNDLRKLFSRVLDRELIQIVLSNSLDAQRAVKIKVRPVLIKDELKFQETLYRGTQVFHANYAAEDLAERLEEYMRELFRQAEIKCTGETVIILVSKKGTVTVKRKQNRDMDAEKKPGRDLSHNRTKQYILQEGSPVDFLIGLGVQTPDGHIAKARYDKFRQINRYLEFIEDVLNVLPADRTIRIVDFGCGKS